MAVVRTVYVPLSREPEILFGLTLSDLVWFAAAAVADLGLWTEWRVKLSLRLVVMAAVWGLGTGLALIRIQEASLPEWFGRWVIYIVKPHLYLP